MDLLNRLSRGTVYRRFGGPDPGSGLSDGLATSAAGLVSDPSRHEQEA
jgi:hypothetical protein